MNDELSKEFKSDFIFINCPLVSPLDEEFRVVIEAITSTSKKSGIRHLALMLQTSGGTMEAVERLVSVMRKHYKEVSFIIPDYAYSAGTVLALSGDSIHMDYYSVLGPIDPQYRLDGKMVPGVGYLSKFKELTKEINEAQVPLKAQLSFLTKKFDPGVLFHIEQSINHGEALITEWLVKYKFKDWKQDGKKVSASKKKKQAQNIAKILGDAKKWHSHGRGISMLELSNEVGLRIKNFGENEGLSRRIRNYHGLCVDYYSAKCHIKGYIHSSLDMRRVL